MKKNKVNNRIQAPPPPKGETAGIIFKTIFLCMIIGVAALGWFIGIWVIDVLAETPELDTNLILSEQSALIFDREGELIQEFGIQMSEWVSLSEISPVMVDAIIAIEDSRFFDHYGVDWSRTIAAVGYTLRGLITGTDSMQGGSTLTQQLINQTHLLTEDGQRDNSIERKLQEVWLAIQIEQVYSKEQIIEAYLNIAPFGGRIIGIQAASQFYFGVNADQLNLSQAATLAGLVQQPSNLRPDWHAISTQSRRNDVLWQMYNHDFITAEIYELVRAEPLTDLLVYNEAGIVDRHRYEPFLNMVHEEARERFGITDITGHQIHTTLDREAMTFLYELLMTNDRISWPNETIETTVSMIANDGRIRAIGNRNLQREAAQQGWNPAVHDRRQPGSAAKPIWAYGPAFELLDWGTGTMVNDDLFGYDGSLPGSIIVRNWNNQYNGRLTVRDAMSDSWNTPAIRAYQAVIDRYGQQAMDDFVNSMGIPTPESGFNQRYAIGGHYHGVSTMQMAGAYAVFPNGGTFMEPFAIERIIAPDGTILYGEDFRDVTEIMRPESAYMMNDILRTAITGDAHSNGTGSVALNMIGGDWFAGKTGTTNFDEEQRIRFNMPTLSTAVPDSWFVGYSMDYTIAIWTGYRDRNSGYFLDFNATRIPQHVFAHLMNEFNTGGTTRPTRPSGLVEVTVELHSGEYDGEACLPSEYTPGGSMFNRRELFHTSNIPTCVSDRFSNPESPTDLQVETTGGLGLSFTWEHIEEMPMTLEEAEAAIGTARSLYNAGGLVTQEMLELRPSEGEAMMLRNIIIAMGEATYVLIGVRADGSEIELYATTDNQIELTLSMMDAIEIETFHVVTRFVESGRTSEPSNFVFNQYLFDLENLEMPLEDMTNWTRDQVMSWLASHPEVNYIIHDMPSQFVMENFVIHYTPTGTLRLDQVLEIFISTGPDDDAGPWGGWPGMPGVPGGEPDDSPWGTPQPPGGNQPGQPPGDGWQPPGINQPGQTPGATPPGGGGQPGETPPPEDVQPDTPPIGGGTNPFTENFPPIPGGPSGAMNEI